MRRHFELSPYISAAIFSRLSPFLTTYVFIEEADGSDAGAWAIGAGLAAGFSSSSCHFVEGAGAAGAAGAGAAALGAGASCASGLPPLWNFHAVISFVVAISTS